VDIKFDILRFEGGDAAQGVIEILQSHGYIAYLAGGCVRDMLLNKIPKDFDIATNCLPSESAKIFEHAKEVGKSFGVMLIKNMGHYFELATFREDFDYKDGRRPEKVSFSDPLHDSQRRDFTINSMFYDPIASELFDYNNGIDDLKLKLVRFVGNAEKRITEDHLRMLRAIRFESILNFTLEEQTEKAIKKNCELIQKLSPERIRDEFSRIMCESVHPGDALKRLNNLGLLENILPFFSEFDTDTMNMIYDMMNYVGSDLCFELAMAIILQFAIKDNNISTKKLKHLKLSTIQKDTIRNVLTNIHKFDNFYNLPTYQKKLLFSSDFFGKSFKLLELRFQFDLAEQINFDELQAYHKLNKGFELPAPLITGKDLISKGINPCKRFGELLDKVYKAQLNEQIHTRYDALKLLDRMLNDE
jgi:tRNA nucleotidyltransferase/poly(A) polymerase